MAPEALDSLTPEERHELYKMLRLKARVLVDGTAEIGGALGGEQDFVVGNQHGDVGYQRQNGGLSSAFAPC
jgi:hypothetical protein